MFDKIKVLLYSEPRTKVLIKLKGGENNKTQQQTIHYGDGR